MKLNDNLKVCKKIITKRNLNQLSLHNAYVAAFTEAYSLDLSSFEKELADAIYEKIITTQVAVNALYQELNIFIKNKEITRSILQQSRRNAFSKRFPAIDDFSDKMPLIHESDLLDELMYLKDKIISIFPAVSMSVNIDEPNLKDEFFSDFFQTTLSEDVKFSKKINTQERALLQNIVEESRSGKMTIGFYADILLANDKKSLEKEFILRNLDDSKSKIKRAIELIQLLKNFGAEIDDQLPFNRSPFNRLENLTLRISFDED